MQLINSVKDSRASVQFIVYGIQPISDISFLNFHHNLSKAIYFKILDERSFNKSPLKFIKNMLD